MQIPAIMMRGVKPAIVNLMQMKIKTIAVDDAAIYLKTLERLCSRLDIIEWKQTFLHPEAALQYMEQNPVDLIFLDIRMPAMSGLDFCRKLRSKPMIVFTTAYEEYALEAFDLEILDYLVKPYSLVRFGQTLGKVREQYNLMHNPHPVTKQHLILKVDYGLVQVALADIIFVEGFDNYMKIYLNDGKRIMARITRKSLSERLPEEDFVQVHRSYIVSLSKIQQVHQKAIILGGREIPIGISFEARFFSRYKPKYS